MKKLSSLLLFLLLSAALAFAQSSNPGYKSQDVSETDGVPILIKHLPDWENVRSQTVLTDSMVDVRKELADVPVITSVELGGGAEAAVAPYREGRLLLIEYPTPQGSV